MILSILESGSKPESALCVNRIFIADTLVREGIAEHWEQFAQAHPEGDAKHLRPRSSRHRDVSSSSAQRFEAKLLEAARVDVGVHCPAPLVFIASEHAAKRIWRGTCATSRFRCCRFFVSAFVCSF